MRAIWVVRWQNRLVAGMARSYSGARASSAVGARHARDMGGALAESVDRGHGPLLLGNARCVL